MITQINALFGIWKEPIQGITREIPVEDYMVSAIVTDEKEFLHEFVRATPEGDLKRPEKEYSEY